MVARAPATLLFQAHRRSVAYRLALVAVSKALRPHECEGCALALALVEAVDRLPSPPSPVEVESGCHDAEDDMVMDAMDVAIAFGVELVTVYDWVTQGRIPSFLHRGRISFRTEVIDAMLR